MQPDFEHSSDVELAYLALLFLVIGAFVLGVQANRRPRRVTIAIPLASTPATPEIAESEGETNDE